MRTRAVLLAALLGAGLLLPARTLADDTPAPNAESPKTKVKTKVKTIVIQRGDSSYLGIGVGEIDSDRARTLGLKDEYGVEVKSVEDGSPASKAGLKEGDVVLEYNGQRVEGTAQLIRMVRETPVGRQVKLLTSHDGRTQTVTATIGKRSPQVFKFKGNALTPEVHQRVQRELERAQRELERAQREQARGDDDEETPESAEAPEPPEPPEPPETPEPPDVDVEVPEVMVLPQIEMPDIPSPHFSWNSPRLGVEGEALGEQLAQFFGVKEGVLVRSVVKGSAAEKAGIRAGDVVVKIGTEKITSPSDIRSAMRSASADKPVPVTVIRAGKETALSVTIPKETSSSSWKTPYRRGLLSMRKQAV